jgi:hypothetical protein
VSSADDRWQGFDAAVGSWRLGDLEAERLPAAAVEALSAGCESPSLGQLAALEGAGWSEIEPVVTRVLDERGRSLPTPEEAVKLVADDVLRQLAASALAPEAAADRLRVLAWRVADHPAWEDLAPFVSLAGDWDAVAAGRLDRAAWCEQVVRAGRELLARGGVRTG